MKHVLKIFSLIIIIAILQSHATEITVGSTSFRAGVAKINATLPIGTQIFF